MTVLRGIYEEIMADLVSKGFGGYVENLDHDYKNATAETNSRVLSSNTPSKTKNDEPAVRPLSGGFSLLFKEVA